MCVAIKNCIKKKKRGCKELNDKDVRCEGKTQKELTETNNWIPNGNVQRGKDDMRSVERTKSIKTRNDYYVVQRTGKSILIGVENHF